MMKIGSILKKNLSALKTYHFNLPRGIDNELGYPQLFVYIYGSSKVLFVYGSR